MFTNMLTGNGETDIPTDSGQRDSQGPSIPLAALLARPPIDPDLNLVSLTVRVPEYIAEAVRMLALLQRTPAGRRRSQQDIAAEILRKGLPPDLLAECYRAAENAHR
jgi:hypothetical protein